VVSRDAAFPRVGQAGPGRHPTTSASRSATATGPGRSAAWRGRSRLSLLGGLLLASGVVAALAWALPRLLANRGTLRGPVRAPATIAERVAEHGAAARARLAPHFAAAGVPYPPREVVLVGLKSEAVLEVYASGAGTSIRRIRDYAILAASGGPGPKLRQGDRQVPEGLYRIELLNPNSRYHLSLRVDYPNAFDRQMAADDGRTGLGGDIMIHGSDVSIGCLAMGDEAAEDLFVLAADTGIERLRVILAPADLRRVAAPEGPALPAWAPRLYADIARELARLRP
jgi:hypothetical protein